MKTLTKILIGLTVLGGGIALGALLLNNVPIFDPPGWKTRLLIYFSENSAMTDANSPLPELHPRSYSLSSQRLFEIARASAIDLEWRIKSVDATNLQLEIVVTTALLRFQDDVSVQVRSMPGNTSSLRVHARSRVGRADFGANLAHVIRLQRKIREKIAAE